MGFITKGNVYESNEKALIYIFFLFIVRKYNWIVWYRSRNDLDIIRVENLSATCCRAVNFI